MAHQYKQPRTCDCGYTTIQRSNWSTHKRYCKLLPDQDKEKQYLKEQVQILLEDKVQLKEQIDVKDRQLTAQADEISQMRLLLQERFNIVTMELKEIRKRKGRYADQITKRVHRTEPERRKIAIRQNWKCAGHECSKELEEYDIDHIIPLSLGGKEDIDNLQALCPGCHRKKTDRERMSYLSQNKHVATETLELNF